MADTVGTIEYDARINTKQLESDAKNIEKNIGESAERGGSSFVSAMGKATAIGAVAFGALAGAAVKSFASYEQLTGGVETLFKNSAPIVENYATNAYKTAGLSANAYMETVTSFSASLLQGVGGDTEKAAHIADMAISDMSDNANKLGTGMSIIQNAYIAFAKGNFTLLDNLKLGYGGTQEEMARLINETGVMGDSFVATAENIREVPFDKLIEGIHKVQDEMGITGTTAMEASETISGSWNSLKGAFTNVVTGVEGSGQQMADTMINMFDQLAEKVPQIIGRMVSGMTDAIKTAIDEQFGNGAYDIISTVAVFFTVLAGAVTAYHTAVSIATGVQALFNAVMAANPVTVIVIAVIALVAALIYFFTQTELGQKIIEKLTEAFWTVKDAVVGFINGAIDIFKGFVDFIKEWGVTILAILLLPFTLIVAAIYIHWDTIKSVFQAGYDFVVGVWQGIGDWFRGKWNEIVEVFSPVSRWFGDRFTEASNAVTGAFGGVVDWFRNLWNDIKGLFGQAGGAIGESLGSKFSSVINAILRHVADKINGFIHAINNAITLMNRVPNVNIGQVGYLAVPQLAEGGIIPRTKGGLLANIGEGRESEAVIPLSKLDSMLSESGGGRSSNVTYNINMTGVMTSSPTEERNIARRLIDRINEEQRAKGFNELGVV